MFTTFLKRIFTIGCFVLLGLMLFHPAFKQKKEEVKAPTQKTQVKDNVSDAEWALYKKVVEARIKSRWSSPKLDKDASATVSFEILKDGTIKNVTLTKSSNNKQFDDVALKTIQNSAPYRRLPVGYGGESISFDFTFQYQLQK
ncbi:TonB C-terminal domain-containing protein [bacterium]|nr:TonB C-terminal domain-containing protein [bacterium]